MMANVRVGVTRGSALWSMIADSRQNTWDMGPSAG